MLLLPWLLAACAALPPTGDRGAQAALAPEQTGPLAETARQSLPGADLSGFRLLASGPQALQARIELIDGAQRSVDLQVYQFRVDASGVRVIGALRAAAARGVRVRLLLDDLYTAGDDEVWLDLAQQPNVEVRLFNPFVAGRASQVGRLFDAFLGDERLHRRMHNKLLVADGVFAVTGGRNIGDPYFLHDVEAGYFDLDLLSAGAVVAPLAAVFDEFWNSAYSHDVRTIVVDERPQVLRQAAVAQRFAAVGHAPATGEPGAALRLEFAARRVELVVAPVQVVFDPPRKIESAGRGGAGPPPQSPQALVRVGQAMLAARRELVAVSPYLIPGPQGTGRIRQLTGGGVRVVLLTNSLAATDERLAHIGYRHYRAEVLRAGAQLYELRPTQGGRVLRELAVRGTVLRLHAKCALIDRERLYIGSMNFDPRSRDFNTELGLLIDSPDLTAQAGALVDDVIQRAAWRVRLAEDGHSLRWSMADGDGAEHDIDPDTDRGSRLLLDLLAPFVPEELL